MNFNIYFFRESQKSIDFDRILAFFSHYEQISYEVKDEEGIFTYYDEAIDNKANFIISRKLLVPNIFKIKPNFINLNFHLEISAFVPDFKARLIFEIAEAFSKEFGLFVYNELLDNAVEFNMDLLLEVYHYFKTVCKEKFPEDYSHFSYLESEKLAAILNYQKSNYELQLEYLNENIVAPSYLFLKDNFGVVRVAMKWKEGTDTIFPMELDYIYYETSNLETHIYQVSDVYEEIGKYLLDLPGFQRGTKMVDKKESKHIRKSMKKSKMREITQDFEMIKVGNLIDC